MRADIADSDTQGAEDVELRQRKRGAVLEDAIRTAALEELAECGYGEFSIECVAGRAETGKASIYRRWPTKQALVIDAMCAVAAQQCAPTHDLGQIPDDLTTEQALKQIGRKIIGLMGGVVGEVLRELSAQAPRDSELAEALEREFHAPRRASMQALLARGVERGEVRPDAALALAGEVMPAMLSHRIVLRRQAVSEQDIDDIVDRVVMPLVRSCAQD